MKLEEISLGTRVEYITGFNPSTIERGTVVNCDHQYVYVKADKTGAVNTFHPSNLMKSTATIGMKTLFEHNKEQIKQRLSDTVPMSAVQVEEYERNSVRCPLCLEFHMVLFNQYQLLKLAACKSCGFVGIKL